MENRLKSAWAKVLAYTAYVLSVIFPTSVASSAVQAPDNGIVVTADEQQRPLSDIVEDFTGSSATERAEQVAYWDTWLCVKIEGLISPDAIYLQKRIEGNLRQSGLHTLPEPNCTANVEIVFPPDADAYVLHFVKDNPGFYRDLRAKGSPPPEEVDDLLKPRAVRWVAVRRDININMDASHITLNTGATKTGELVVVDYRRLHHVSWDQLADYVSMVILTNPDMDTDFSRDGTILALFASSDDGSRAPPEMTDRDHLIVKSFGKMGQLDMPSAQRDTIARTVEAAEKQAPAR